jgi:hypothetical protein
MILSSRVLHPRRWLPFQIKRRIRLRVFNEHGKFIIEFASTPAAPDVKHDSGNWFSRFFSHETQDGVGMLSKLKVGSGLDLDWVGIGDAILILTSVGYFGLPDRLFLVVFPDPHKRILVLFTQKIVSKLSEI